MKSYILKILLFISLLISVLALNIIYEKYQVYINSEISNITPLSWKKYYYKYKSQNNNFPHLKLIIPDAGYDELKKNRLTALHNENGKSLLTKSIRNYVDSKVVFNGKVIDSKIRLKGLMKGHWEDPIKWSFKVKLKEDKIFGLKKFGLMTPVQRGCINEWVFHKLNDHLNNLSLKYEFIELSLNDMYLGNYVIEEAFDTKNHNSNNKIILKFDLNNYYEKLRNDSLPSCIEEYNYLHIPKCFYEQLKIISYGKSNECDFIYAKNLLSKFRDGKLKTHEVFDIEKLAGYISVTTLMGNQHPFYLHNVRIMYNKKSKLLEIIPYDLERYHLISEEESYEKFLPWKRSYFRNTFLDQIMSDKIFREKYFETLSKLVESQTIDDFLKDNLNQIDYIKRNLKSDCVDLEIDLLSAIKINRDYIKRLLYNKSIL